MAKIIFSGVCFGAFVAFAWASASVMLGVNREVAAALGFLFGGIGHCIGMLVAAKLL